MTKLPKGAIRVPSEQLKPGMKLRIGSRDFRTITRIRVHPDDPEWLGVYVEDRPKTPHWRKRSMLAVVMKGSP